MKWLDRLRRMRVKTPIQEDTALIGAHWFWLTLLVLSAQAQLAYRLPVMVAGFGIGITVLRVLSIYLPWRRSSLSAQEGIVVSGDVVARYSAQKPPFRWKPWLSLSLGLTALVVVRVAYGYLFYRDASVGLLFILVAIKFSESTTRRDAMLLVCLSSFLLITTFFYTQSPLILLTSMLPFFALGGALDAIFQPRASLKRTHVRRTMKRFSFLVLQGIPIALVLFMLFPRLSAPLWGLPQAQMAQTGLSESMGPLDIMELSLSDAIAFRVDFEGEPPPNAQRYWRGPVLSFYDGVSWSQGPTLPSKPKAMAAGEKEIRYTVTMEPHHRHWLFAIEAVSQLPQLRGMLDEDRGRSFAYLTGTQQLLSIVPVDQALTYTQTSVLRSRYPAQADDDRWNVRLPEKGNPRARELARQLRADVATSEDYVRTVLAYFHNEPFSYTLSPEYVEKEPIDGFLFETREGFCEHYASAFVILMRAVGIPARVVTGYQGGEINPQGGYMIVRQSDAHAWTEVLIDGQWERVDPTAAVSPERIEYGLGRALPDDSRVPAFARMDAGWFKVLALNWDAIRHGWTRNVVDFNYQRQRQLWRDLHLDGPAWKVVGVLIAVVAVWVGLLVLFLAWRARRREPVQALWRELCKGLARAGLPRVPEEGPQTYLGRASNHWPEWQTVFAQIGQTYVVLRYGALSETQYREKIRLLREAVKKVPAARNLRLSSNDQVGKMHAV